MITPFRTLFYYKKDTQIIGIFLDTNNEVCLNPAPVLDIKGTKFLTKEEYLNLLELEKINLHILYILSLLEQE